jgi:hypothetical protein
MDDFTAQFVIDWPARPSVRQMPQGYPLEHLNKSSANIPKIPRRGPNRRRARVSPVSLSRLLLP